MRAGQDISAWRSLAALVLLLIGLLLLPLLLSCSRSPALSLTPLEEQWVAEHGDQLEVLFGYEAPPNAFHGRGGRYQGLLVDFLEEIQRQSGLRFRYRNFATWRELMAYARTGRRFIIVGIADSVERRAYLSFTDAVLKVPYVVVSQESVAAGSMAQLAGAKVCTVAGYAINEFLAQHYPQLQPQPVSDNLEGLRAVSTGRCSAMIINQMYASYLIEDQGLANLKIAGESGYLNRLGAAVSREDPVLFSIIDKGVDHIPQQLRRRLYRKWLGQEEAFPFAPLLYGLMGVLTLALLVAGLFWGWNRKLKREVERRTREIIKSRQNLETTLHSIGDGVVTTNAQGVISGMNRVAVELTGWSGEEAVGRPLTEVFQLVHSSTREPFRELLGTVCGGREVVGLSDPATLVGRHGQEYQVSVSTAPIMDAGESCYGTVLAFQDISEAYAVRAQLERSERTIRGYFDQAPLGSGVVDGDGRLVEVNQRMCRLSGYSREELEKKTLTGILAPEGQRLLTRAITEFQAEATSSLTSEYIHHSGEKRICTIALLHLEDAGLLFFFNDVTEQKRAEQELLQIDKLKSIGTLAGGIAHDFNNFIMAIYGNISLARGLLNADHPAAAYLENAENSMGRATRLSQQLLTFSKGGDPVRGELDLCRAVEEIVELDLAGSNVRAAIHCSPDLWSAHADRGQIQQVLSNIFINGDQAMPEGGVLECTLENVTLNESSGLPLAAGRYIRVRVRDSGVGIAQEHLGRIFDPYFTTKRAGNGLGLAAVYSIISKHHGHVLVDSRPGEGALFTLFLPASEHRFTRASAPSESEEESGLPTAPLLVMDDEPAILVFIQRVLEQAGCQVVTSSDGQEAVECLRQGLEAGRPLTMAILDLTVPGGMGGLEAAEQLRALDPGIRLIVSSGYAKDPVLADYGSYGFDGCIAKPYSKKQLLQEIRRVAGMGSRGESAAIAGSKIS
ncbi:PAS domain S-box protein [Desulfogranum mediterraneum]|uniref:PAS domain S-box protein n=1 Tax=Desulfogranum mediterraneum TaxID=160661 RepID=UPI0003FCEF9F|nr:transporter substrate-binding domain-containing protein [Desulfogranum mediterraneum]